MSNFPDGVTESTLPGNTPRDYVYHRAEVETCGLMDNGMFDDDDLRAAIAELDWDSFKSLIVKQDYAKIGEAIHRALFDHIADTLVDEEKQLGIFGREQAD